MLLALLQKGEITSEQILIIYYKRAITVGRDLELLADINFEEALEQARKCDKLRQSNPDICLKKHLFGIPISIKDTFDQKGIDNTLGMASQCFKPCEDDGFVIKLLKAQGAIPFIRSSCPQAVMSMETINNIWGIAKNPWNITRSPGGSSGGEGALIAARCSPLGLGSDIGGSIRIPSLFNGLYGLKSGLRFSTKGFKDISECYGGQTTIPNSIGPIGKSVNDLRIFAKSMLDKDTYFSFNPSERDSYLAFIPWDDNIYHDNSKKRIGLFRGNNICGISNSHNRALSEAAQALINKGHEVIEVEIPWINEVYHIGMQIYLAGGKARYVKDGLKTEKMGKIYEGIEMITSMTNSKIDEFARQARANNFERLAAFAESCKELNAYEYTLLIHKQMQIQNKFFEFWSNNKLDGLIFPGLAVPPFRCAEGGSFGIQCAYTIFANVMKLSAGALPITLVRQDEQVYNKMNQSKYWDQWSEDMAQQMMGTEGLPVGIQVFGLPYEDEKVLGLMRQIDEEIQFSKKHKCSYP